MAFVVFVVASFATMTASLSTRHLLSNTNQLLAKTNSNARRRTRTRTTSICFPLYASTANCTSFPQNTTSFPSFPHAYPIPIVPVQPPKKKKKTTTTKAPRSSSKEAAPAPQTTRHRAANTSTKRMSTQTTLALSKRAAVLMGIALAFQSGVINGATLSGCLGDGTAMGTAAVTGAWTNSALGASRAIRGGSTAPFLFNSRCIASFVGGSLLGGLLLPHPKAYEVDVDSTLRLLGLSSCLLMLSSGLARATKLHYLYLALLANGLQNSLTSSLTKNLCRTSHMSGISSDLGTYLGQVLKGNTENLEKLKTIAFIAVSFWTGGCLSLGWAEALGHKVLLVAAAFPAIVASWIRWKASRAAACGGGGGGGGDHQTSSENA